MMDSINGLSYTPPQQPNTPSLSESFSASLLCVLSNEHVEPPTRTLLLDNLSDALDTYFATSPDEQKTTTLIKAQSLFSSLQELVGKNTDSLLALEQTYLQLTESPLSPLTTHPPLSTNSHFINDEPDIDQILILFKQQFIAIIQEVLTSPSLYKEQAKTILREKYKHVFFENPHTSSIEKTVSPHHILQESVNGIRHMSGQIFHRHVNLSNNNDQSFILPHNLKSILSQSALSPKLRKQYSSFFMKFFPQPENNQKAGSLPICTKDDVYTTVSLLLDIAIGTLHHELGQEGFSLDEICKLIVLPFKNNIPQFHHLLDSVKACSSKEEIVQAFVTHLKNTDHLLYLIYTTPQQKQFLTQQLVSGLLRMEVDDPDYTQDAIYATYGTSFTLNKDLQKTLKTHHISLMDFTVDMLSLREGDIKVLIYAILCPKVTGDEEHPVASPDNLYIVSGKDLNTLELTPKGLAYFSRAFNAGIDRHFKDTYNMPAATLLDQTQIREFSLEGGVGYPFSFSSTQEILDLFAGSYPLTDYDKANISDYLASTRCFLHIAGRHGLDVDKIVSSNITDGYQNLFSLQPMRLKKSQELANGDFKKLQFKNSEGKVLGFDSGVNPDGVSWYFPDVKLGPHITGSFSGRVKTLDSMVRKMRNDAKYKHAKYVGDVVACRYEINKNAVLTNGGEQILEVGAKFFKRLYGSPDNRDSGFARMAIKGSSLFSAVGTFLSMSDADKEKKLSERGISDDYGTLYHASLQRAYDDAKNLQGKYANTKTASGREELKFVTHDGTEYQIVHKGTEDAGFLHHMFYDLKKFVNDKLRVNNFTRWSQLKRAANTQLMRGTEHSVTRLQQAYPDTFINKTFVTYAFKRLLLDQIRGEKLSRYTAKEGFSSIVTQKSMLDHTTIEDYYDNARSFHTDPLTNTMIVHKKIEKMDKEILGLLLYEARKQVDYLVEHQQFGSTRIDTKILDAYIDIFYSSDNTSKQAPTR